jgi:sigma-E factor negative regulatory protein RseC
MIEAQATVMKIEGGVTYVRTNRKSACGTCSSGGECGSTSLIKLLGGKEVLFRAVNEVGARVGEEVLVGVEESALTSGSAAAYLVPLLFLILGAAAGTFLGGTPSGKDAYAVLGALAGLAAGFAVLKWFSGRVGASRKYQPVILRRLSRPSFICVGKEC